MKIKLQDYSLISNEWIDKEINRLTNIARECVADNVNADVYAHYIRCLEGVKEQLIPSEKLADVEDKQGFPLYTNFGTKQEFITSEIELL